MSIQQFPASDGRFNPTEVLTDPVNKLRTSTAQALIDTDFEYGTQQSKWENLGVTNNRPFAFQVASPMTNIASMTMNTDARIVTVALTTTTKTVTGADPSTPSTGYVTYTTSSSHGFRSGQYVTISGSSVSGYNGTFQIVGTLTSTTFSVVNATTGTEVWTSGSAIAGVAPPTGTAITVQDTFLAAGNGNFIIESGGGTASFTYLGRAQNKTTVTSILDPNKTAIYEAVIYTDARIGGAPTLAVSGLKVTVTTTVPHGLSIGNTIATAGITGTNPPNGAYRVATVATPTTFVFYADPTEGTPSGLTATNASIYVRPQAQFLHRSFDGGVLFSTNASSNYEQAIRQTRRYFRYQSGKGLQVSSGTILKPYATIDGITSSGTTATVTTKEQHNILPGTSILVSGANEAAYNGTFSVDQVTSFNTFTYELPESTTSPATGIVNLNVTSWYGSSTRLGTFDAQNGLFWEIDGQDAYVVKRSSTQQLSGRSSVVQGSNVVTRTDESFPTSYSSQLIPGDYVIIRGQSYRVIAIDDLSVTPNFTISPSYRGASADHVNISKTIDTRIPQSEWNLDKADGTGPSGFNVDFTKMQMFYVDYSWYGAGFIRWGLRGIDGNVFYVHKMKNNNVNNEAYMRSGNLPARYETSTLPPTTRLDASLSDTGETLTVLSTAGFPPTGTLIIKPSTTNNEAGLFSEYVNYTGKTATTFTGLVRGKAGASGVSSTWTIGSNSGIVASATGLQVGQRVFSSASPSPVPDGAYITNIAGTVITLNTALTGSNPTLIFAPMGAEAKAYTYSAPSPTSVELAYPTFAPSISHWGTSVIMDGRFDEDNSLIFTYGQTNPVSILPGQSKALFAVRLAPSADNGVGALFGQRELINRMQLKLSELGVSTQDAGTNYLVRAYLNATPSVSATWTIPNFADAGTANSSLAQIADYSVNGNVTVSGGEITGGFLSQGTDSISLRTLRDLGNSILGGGSSSSRTGIYPDGPDVLTIVVTNTSSGSNTARFTGRLSWTEAQA
jgi:hypothetical protein